MRARLNYAQSSPQANEQEINSLLNRMPSEWKNQLFNSREKLRAAGAPASQLPPERPTAQTALRALNLNNQGAISSESGVTERGEPVPEDVRAAAMEGIRQSWANNYGGYDFIGVARAIQLAISPRISSAAKNRMRMYFDRKTKQDRLSDQYAKKFGKRYWSWLNWGGDPGARWAASTRFKQLVGKSNPGRGRTSRTLLFPERIAGRVWKGQDAALAFMGLDGKRAASVLAFIQSQSDLVAHVNESAKNMNASRSLSPNQIRSLGLYWIKPWIFGTAFNRKLGYACGLSVRMPDDPDSWADVQYIAHWKGNEVVFFLEPGPYWIDLTPAPASSDQRVFIPNNVSVGFTDEEDIAAVQNILIDNIRYRMPRIGNIDLNTGLTNLR